MDGTISILFVGQGGGRDERKLKRPFIGRAGKRLRQQVLYARKKLGKHFGVAFSNTIRDNPQDNRIPTEEELNFCLPFLYADIKALMARGLKVVVPLGNAAKSALITSGTEGMFKDHGKVFHVKDCEFGAIKVIPTYHPSYVMRTVANFNVEQPSELDLTVIRDITYAYEIGLEDTVVISPDVERQIESESLFI
jgi:DNA polymerase